MSFQVHNTQDYLTEEAQSYLKDHDCEIIHGGWNNLSESEICREVRGLDAVIAGGESYSRKVFEAADRLKIVARTGAGYDRIDLVAATNRGIWVTNTPGATSPAVAEHTVCLILCLLRSIPRQAQDMKRGKWVEFRGRELGSLTLGIVGTGSIGQAVIKRARAFGTRVLGYDIRPDHGFASEYQVKYLPLDELLSQSDIVSIHVSLDETTRGLIDERALGLMKKSAYLVNTSRGAVVDRSALLKALQTKEIAGAALDAHHTTPCPPDDSLVALDNVLATPHSAYNTEEAIARMSITVAKDVIAVLHGRAPAHPVNPKLDSLILSGLGKE